MLLTIFTPAYNRANLLPRLYESLKAQTVKDFEWLIVDDGSTDNTEETVNGFIMEAKINIRYIKKENGGKHTAHNLAVTEVEGELFFCVDSDDFLTVNAVECVLNCKELLGEKDYAIFGYKSLNNGRLLCSEFPVNMEHTGFYKMTKGGIKGEYSIVMKTDLIRKYPFPVIEGERFSTEAVLYDKMELSGYNVCPCNEVLTVCEYQPDGLTGNAYKLLKNNPVTYQIYHLQRLDLVDSFKERFFHALKYNAFKSISRNGEFVYKGGHRFLVALTAPLGAICSVYYKLR